MTVCHAAKTERQAATPYVTFCHAAKTDLEAAKTDLEAAKTDLEAAFCCDDLSQLRGLSRCNFTFLQAAKTGRQAATICYLYVTFCHAATLPSCRQQKSICRQEILPHFFPCYHRVTVVITGEHFSQNSSGPSQNLSITVLQAANSY